ncbi:DUF1307 domain-containing protein [Catenisphaera adipataccumulans]|uniref:Uncharacterized lipoprotein YehR (DUF1307 family) n=1 Tax=Catenisphaera adipataccumulans TaxID=700500 RepID=A0A7W8CYU1_9FIRM|nr:DUF1307 domain-containing protein [Catenisphaera adipataccumulans]MBB5183509.1 uncharacterized lipoprotein YehR (DUF1307 family) [Catenisphaera adipataccumulans]
MKKWIGMLLIGALVLTGCSSQSGESTGDTTPDTQESTKSKVLVCTGDNDEQVTLEATGDKIKKMTIVSYMEKSDLGITDEMDAETIQNAINDSLSEKYNIDGVTAEGALEDDRVKITVTVNYEEANQEDLINAGLVEKGEKQSQYTSLKATKKAYKNAGYSCDYQ